MTRFPCGLRATPLEEQDVCLSSITVFHDQVRNPFR